MKCFLFIFLFSFAILGEVLKQEPEAREPDIRWKRIELGSYKDSISSNIVEYKFFDGLTHNGGTLLELLDQDYLLSHYSNDFKHLIVLEELFSNGDGTNKSKIIDMIEINGLEKNQYISYGFCSIDNVNDSGVFAVYEYENTEEFTKIYKAWKAIPKERMIKEINTKGVSCINEGYSV
ncbi:hypothetical protein [Marinifilum sp. D737]|uniref:hypothetical protein n=1 Tax=Marinifilum sp. D737 TaxID=2969628 RepID=UPI002273EA07|nr:hypothetical protein [Marinifilum sp. D737]MCY1635939.1 hypothetical protein [Marinifilum sp. D737]